MENLRLVDLIQFRDAKSHLTESVVYCSLQNDNPKKKKTEEKKVMRKNMLACNDMRTVAKN